MALGVAAIFGSAGSGKTETLVIVALMFWANPDIGKVYASAPTCVATTNVALRLHRIGSAEVKAFNSRVPARQRRHIPLVVRGYSIKVEVDAFVKIVSGDPLDMLSDPWQPEQWAISLSLCEWLLKIIKFDNYDLDKNDNPGCWSCRQTFETGKDMAGLRAFAKGSSLPSLITSIPTPDRRMHSLATIAGSPPRMKKNRRSLSCCMT